MSKYKILSFLTLALPLPIYLLIVSTMFKITPDVRIYADSTEIIISEYEDMYFVSSALNVKYDGLATYHNDMIGLIVEDTDVIRTNNGYFQIKDMELVNIKREIFEREQSYRVPITFILSMFGVAIVTLVVLGKMNLMKKYPRIATLTALGTGTLILYILNAIIGSVLGVFMVATISWAVYCLEYMIHQGMITQAKADKVESDLLNEMQDMMKKIGAKS